MLSQMSKIEREFYYDILSKNKPLSPKYLESKKKQN